jgi:hypothetical protein
VIDGILADCNYLKIANSSSKLGQLTVTGGATLTTNKEIRLARSSPGGQTAILYIDGPNTQVLSGASIEVGRWGDGTIDIAGGYLATSSGGKLRMAYHTGSVGTIYLRGGTIEVGTGGITVGHNETDIGTALIDIYAGSLVIAGNALTDVNDLLTRLPAVIVGYGGTGTVNAVYEGGETIVTANDPGINNAPVVDAGEDATIKLPADTVKMTATVTDDGRGEPNGFLDISWSVTNQPNNSMVVFDNNNIEEPNVTFDTPGDYVLRIDANDGEFTAGDTVTITVQPSWYIPPLNRSYIVTRLNNAEPIITEQMFIDVNAVTFNQNGTTEGQKTNGPSLMKIPDWIAPADRADPNAVYYLYFAHHQGNYIRMAWSVDLEGPYHLYNVGTGVPLDERGVLSLDPNDELHIGNGIIIWKHIASPDVHIDELNQRIIMYFHSPNNGGGGQRSFVATSPFGLDFNGRVEPVAFGNSYFRVFSAYGDLYAISNGAKMYKALDANNPWTPPVDFNFTNALWTLLDEANNPFISDLSDANLLPLQLRHSALRFVGDTMEVFYSRKEEYQDTGTEERLMLSRIDLSVGDWQLWDSTFPPEEVLKTELDWEGIDRPKDSKRLMCDPYIYEEDGVIYMFYTADMEHKIALATLTPVLPGDFEPDGDRDFNDLAVMAAQWLKDIGFLIADLDTSGQVNLKDFATFLANWSK